MRNRELDGPDDAVVPLDQSFLGAVAGGLNPQPEPPGINFMFSWSAKIETHTVLATASQYTAGI
jgi:hypothetical protein